MLSLLLNLDAATLWSLAVTSKNLREAIAANFRSWLRDAGTVQCSLKESAQSVPPLMFLAWSLGLWAAPPREKLAGEPEWVAFRKLLQRYGRDDPWDEVPVGVAMRQDPEVPGTLAFDPRMQRAPFPFLTAKTLKNRTRALLATFVWSLTYYYCWVEGRDIMHGEIGGDAAPSRFHSLASLLDRAWKDIWLFHGRLPSDFDQRTLEDGENGRPARRRRVDESGASASEPAYDPTLLPDSPLDTFPTPLSIASKKLYPKAILRLIRFNEYRALDMMLSTFGPPTEEWLGDPDSSFKGYLKVDERVSAGAKRSGTARWRYIIEPDMEDFEMAAAVAARHGGMRDAFPIIEQFLV
jgi:hypothetical protein